MNSPRQFVSLFAFQAKLNPFIWFMLLALALPLFFMHPFLRDHESFVSILSAPNLFFLGIIGLRILAPEMGQLRMANTTFSVAGTEFLLTLPLDRRILYRSRTAIFYLFVLVTPLIMLLLALRSPDLTATVYEQQARLACLQAVPGSTLQPDPDGHSFPLLYLPGGNILVGEWHLWMFMGAAFLAQLAFSLLFPLKHRVVFFYALFLGTAFVPLTIALVRGSRDYFPMSERLFFFFAGHQVIFWLASEVLFIAGQLWCEQRFIRQEY